MYRKNYQEIVEQAYKGKILIGIEPAVARRFFTDTDRSVIKKKIGESLFIECFLVKMCWLLELICLLGGIIISILGLNWYSVIAIPIMLIACFILGAKASMGRQKIGGAVFLVIICVLLAYYLNSKEMGTFIIVWLILLPLPYFFACLTYKLATIFLRLLSLRNEKAFRLLHGRGIFLKEIYE